MTPIEIQAEVKKLARAIYDGRKALYASPPQWRSASLTEFPHLDLGFYERATAEVVAEGFALLADQENVVASRAWPEFQTVVRGFLGDGGATTAGVWHTRPLGRTRTLAIERGTGGASIRGVSFATEFDDGAFLLTNNVKGHDLGVDIPGVEVQRFGQQAPIAGLLKVHRAAVQRRVEGGGGAGVRHAKDLADVMESGRRHHALAAAHMARIGYFDEAHGRAQCDRLSHDVLRMLLRELAELSEGGKAHV
jgi:hypothetical protein